MTDEAASALAEHEDPEHEAGAGDNEQHDDHDDENDEATPDEDDEATPDEDDEATPDEDDEATPAAPAPPSAPASEKTIEVALRALAKEDERHTRRVAEIMGDDFNDLDRCPLCPSPFSGFRFPVPPPADVIAAVKAAIGEPAEPPLKADSYSKVCDLCEGFGSVTTGSRVAGFAKVQCLGCSGRGWVAVGPERAAGNVTALHAPAPAIDYTQPPPAAPEPPEVAALKAQGYVVVAPFQPPEPAAA